MLNRESHRLADFSLAVRESTIKRLCLVKAGNMNWRPTDDAMSIADIAQHLIDADLWLFEKIKNPSLNSIKGEAKISNTVAPLDFSELLERLNRIGQERAEFIRGLDGLALEKMIPDDRFGGEVSIWWVIVRGNLDHEIHHRGQISVYLKLLNRK
jgi:uncharacterized damage-inducible protein DinB